MAILVPTTKGVFKPPKINQPVAFLCSSAMIPVFFVLIQEIHRGKIFNSADFNRTTIELRQKVEWLELVGIRLIFKGQACKLRVLEGVSEMRK